MGSVLAMPVTWPTASWSVASASVGLASASAIAVISLLTHALPCFFGPCNSSRQGVVDDVAAAAVEAFCGDAECDSLEAIVGKPFQ